MAHFEVGAVVPFVCIFIKVLYRPDSSAVFDVQVTLKEFGQIRVIWDDVARINGVYALCGLYTTLAASVQWVAVVLNHCLF